MIGLNAFCRAKWHPLTESHKIAANLEERERLEAKSGRQIPTNHRLYGMNISRMLGDRYLKEQDSGFTADPYVSPLYFVEDEDEIVIILASDGLWDITSMDRVAGFVLALWKESNKSLSVGAIADALTRFALQQKSRDDITIMILKLFGGDVARGSI